MSRALLVIDVQNDFCEGGSLAVAGGSGVAEAISGFLRDRGAEYAAVVATQDWHVDPGAHFSDHPDFVDTWPAHCLAGTHGAALHDALDTDFIMATFRKGEHAAAYSGFEGFTPGHHGAPVALIDWLHEQEIDAVDLVGIATDHCVRASALDAVRHGLSARVRLDLTAGVALATTSAAIEEMEAAGVHLTGVPVLGG